MDLLSACHKCGNTRSKARPKEIRGHQFGLWLSLVERLVRDQEAVGSNPTSPIIFIRHTFSSKFRNLCEFRAVNEELVEVRRITCLHFEPTTRHAAKTLMGSLKKRRKAKISKHKRRKRMRENRHKKRLRYKA
jgi:hypothetical protein